MYFDETAIVESLIDKTAWLENSHAFEGKKIEKSLSDFSNFLR